MIFYCRSTELLETYNYLRLDYKAVAWAANLADKNITAIYYGELWCIAQNNGVPPVSPEDTSKLDGGETVQKVFHKVTCNTFIYYIYANSVSDPTDEANIPGFEIQVQQNVYIKRK